MGKMNTIAEHIAITGLQPDGFLETRIEETMFDFTDIQQVIPEKDRIFVELRGLNGSVPIDFFTKKSQQKIYRWLKKHKSPLYKTLQNADNY